MRLRPQRSLLYHLLRLLEGANVFFLLMVILFVALFVLGNFQEFLDSSQLMLLRMMSLASMLCIASGLSYVATLVIWMIRRHHLMVLRLLYGLAATVIAAVVTVAGGALDAFVRPV